MGNDTSGIGRRRQERGNSWPRSARRPRNPRRTGRGLTALPLATAHRLAVALEVHRLIGRDVDGRFVLGPRIGELAAALPDPMVSAAQPVLAWIRDESGESAQLYRRDGNERVCVAVAERATGLRTTVPIGTRLPLTAGSAAQVILRVGRGHRTGLLTGRLRVHPTLAGRCPPARLGASRSASARQAVASVSAPVLSGRAWRGPARRDLHLWADRSGSVAPPVSASPRSRGRRPPHHVHPLGLSGRVTS